MVWKADNVLKVPTGALFRRGDAWAVFLVEGNVVRTQVVTLGQRTATDAEVVAGLEAGAAVVLHPPDNLTDGTRVRQRG